MAHSISLDDLRELWRTHNIDGAVLLDEIASLRASLADREKEIERLRGVANAQHYTVAVLTAEKERDEAMALAARYASHIAKESEALGIGETSTPERRVSWMRAHAEGLRKERDEAREMGKRSWANTEQNDDYMDSLNRMPPEKRCYCGWYPLGECHSCPSTVSLADKLRLRCPTCGNAPPATDLAIPIRHARFCSLAKATTR